MAFAAGRTGAAIDSLNDYLLAAGRSGEFYQQALELLDKAELATDAAGAAAEAAAEAARRKPGEVRVFDGMEFVWIAAGEFRMGSTSALADDDERPVTRVRISRGFWLGQIRGDAVGMAGGDGNEPLGVLRLRELSRGRPSPGMTRRSSSGA